MLMLTTIAAYSNGHAILRAAQPDCDLQGADFPVRPAATPSVRHGA